MEEEDHFGAETKLTDINESRFFHTCRYYSISIPLRRVSVDVGRDSTSNVKLLGFLTSSLDKMS